MKYIKAIFIFIFMVLPVVAFADSQMGFLSITSINKDSGTIGVTQQTNLKLPWSDSYTAVNYDGSIIVSKNSLIQGDNHFEIGSDVSSGYRFNENDNLLIFRDSINDLYIKYFFYNLVLHKIEFIYTFDDLPSFSSSYISKNGSTIVLVTTMNSKMSIYTRTNDKYIQTYSLDPGYSSQYYKGIIVSESGNRIFYTHKTETGKSYYFYIDKVSEGGSNETIIPNADQSISNEELLKFKPISSINDGKLLIVQTNKFQVGLVHENNGVWSDVEIAGDYVDKTIAIHDPVHGDYEIKPRYPIVNSDDGRVIALEQPKEFWQDGGEKSYDIYAYIKGQSGQWSKHQINPNQIGATAYNNQEVQLSGDGSKLFWVPERPLAAKSATMFK